MVEEVRIVSHNKLVVRGVVEVAEDESAVRERKCEAGNRNDGGRSTK